MNQKPKFVDRIQRVKVGSLRFAGVSLEGATPDGLYPVDCFKPGMATMHEEDWRQFELTPENAKAMVDKANADLAAGKKLRMNYGHDRSGPIAAAFGRVEFAADGGVRSLVKWTERAQAAIRAGEWEGTSPEFYAKVVLDEQGNPKEVNGRVLMQPFELSGGALDNDPAMPDLAIAANTEPEKPEGAKEDEMETKKLAAMLGLPETASNEDVEAKLKAALTPAMMAMCPKCGTEFKAGTEKAHVCKSEVTTDAIVAAVLAKIETAKNEAIGAIDTKHKELAAVEHEKACVAAVDGAIRGGRVKKSERDAALKVAKADLESFRTMTASMKVVAPVAPVYVPGGEPQLGTVDEEDPGNDEAFNEAAEKRAKEKKISILAAAREIHAEAQAKG